MADVQEHTPPGAEDFVAGESTAEVEAQPGDLLQNAEVAAGEDKPFFGRMKELYHSAMSAVESPKLADVPAASLIAFNQTLMEHVSNTGSTQAPDLLQHSTNILASPQHAENTGSSIPTMVGGVAIGGLLGAIAGGIIRGRGEFSGKGILVGMTVGGIIAHFGESYLKQGGAAITQMGLENITVDNLANIGNIVLK